MGSVLLRDALTPTTMLHALVVAAMFVGLASVAAALIRRATRHLEPHLTDVTALRFVGTLAQVLCYVTGLVLYAHVIPELRALGNALLAGVSVVSVIVGLAAQSTLGNLVAGFSLVLYRPFQLGDCIQLTTPKGLVSARVSVISLGFTKLVDDEQHEIIVPNSVMMSSTVIRVPERS